MSKHESLRWGRPVQYVGRSFTGRLNAQLAAGRGTFVDDVLLPGMAFMAVLRSPHAHARIRQIDVSRARKLLGVVDVVTGQDIRDALKPIPGGHDPSNLGAKSVRSYALSVDRVRYVGEAVVAVVAEDKFTAYQALGLIEVDYEVLPAVVDPIAALVPGAELVEPEWGDNVLLHRVFSGGDAAAAMSSADGVVRGTVRSNRITGVPLEPRGSIANYNPFDQQLTFWDSTQNPHPLRSALAEVLDLPETSIRVIQPNVGGAFGLKQPTFQEQPLVAYMSRRLGRPVKWIEERVENLQAGGHSRDTRFEYEAAYQRDGQVTGLKVRIIADVGAPTALVGWVMSFATAYCLPTVYRIDNVHIELVSVVTNKCPWNSYRGFGKDAASLLMDRVMDHVARAARIDRVMVRARNFIPPDAFPYTLATGAILDSGDYARAMRRVLDMVDAADFERVKAEARRSGRYLGLGIGQELTPEGAWAPGSPMASACDSATVRIHPSGLVTLLTGITSPGNGNETALAQIAADALGCAFEDVKVIQGDTDLCPWGLGNFSGRGILYGGSSARLAGLELRERVLRVAARMLEVSHFDLEAAAGRIWVKDSPTHAVTFAAVAQYAYRHVFGKNVDAMEPGFEVTRFFQPEQQQRLSAYPSWPNAVAACVVEVDRATGRVTPLRLCVVHDEGRLINPLLVDANVHGALVQGIGAALYEDLQYDDAGQFLTGTFMDYTIPTAVEVPNIELSAQETPSPLFPLGTKGVGESGIACPLGALCGAVDDALSDLNVQMTQLPLTPFRVWSAIQSAQSVEDSAQ